MKKFSRLLAIALVSSATLTACGGGGGGGGVATPTTPLSNCDVVIDDFTFGLPPSPVVFTSFEFSAIGGFSIGTPPLGHLF